MQTHVKMAHGDLEGKIWRDFFKTQPTACTYVRAEHMGGHAAQPIVLHLNTLEAWQMRKVKLKSQLVLNS